MRLLPIAAAAALVGGAATARASVIQFFDAGQTIASHTVAATSDTITTNGYIFTYTRDYYFTGNTGSVIGRPVMVDWPAGLHAQFVTTPPPGGTIQHATITISRVDGTAFAIPTFTIKLLANTGGAGADLEVMPKLNGEDAFNNPIMLPASGYTDALFTYTTTNPSYLGNTGQLQGYGKYVMSFLNDYALMSIAVDGAPVNVPEPASAGLLVLAAGALLARRRR